MAMLTMGAEVPALGAYSDKDRYQISDTAPGHSSQKEPGRNGDSVYGPEPIDLGIVRSPTSRTSARPLSAAAGATTRR
jgi:hypothetical protein